MMYTINEGNLNLRENFTNSTWENAKRIHSFHTKKIICNYRAIFILNDDY